MLRPIENYSFSGDIVRQKKGSDLLKSGKVGCLLVAGGQGTRLAHKAPKGTFQINGKSLFEHLIKKIDLPLPLAVMTSPDNDEETRSFFKRQQYFGLKPNLISFFVQNEKPLLTSKGEKVAMGPNGNGEALQLLWKSGIAQEWKKQGIELVNFIPIDNLLADPFDPELVGFHSGDVSIKATHRLSEQEKAGVLAYDNERVIVNEYSDDPPLPKEFNLINLSMLCFSMDFIEKTQNVKLPIHIAEKNYSFYPEPLYKSEHFIFDLLPYSSKTEVLVYPREECFAPLKSLNDLAIVQQALIRRDKPLAKSIEP